MSDFVRLRTAKLTILNPHALTAVVVLLPTHCSVSNGQAADVV